MADPTDREACPPCRGTGKVLSTQGGGDPHEVPCPWCEGSGKRQVVTPSE
jgi:DnaJ-class molecular chaperone